MKSIIILIICLAFIISFDSSQIEASGYKSYFPALDISQQENYSGTITKCYPQLMNTHRGLSPFIAIKLQELPTKMFMVAPEDAKKYGIEKGVEGKKISLSCKRLSQSEEKYIVTNMQIR